MPRQPVIPVTLAVATALLSPTVARGDTTSRFDRLPDGSDVATLLGVDHRETDRLGNAGAEPGAAIDVASGDPMAAALLAASRAAAAASPAIQEVEEESKETFAESLSRARRVGYYFRAGGLVVEQQNDGVVDDTGQAIEFDVGGGLSLAFGYRFGGAPLSIEAEYSFRTVDAEGVGFIGDGDIDLHAFTLNLLFDMPQIIGPVGVYAGGGLGFQLERFRFSSRPGGGGTVVAIEGGGFFWQAKAGLLVNLNETFQLYGGVVWSDAGTLENDISRVNAEMLGIEVGIRLFFF